MQHPRANLPFNKGFIPLKELHHPMYMTFQTACQPLCGLKGKGSSNHLCFAPYIDLVKQKNFNIIAS